MTMAAFPPKLVPVSGRVSRSLQLIARSCVAIETSLVRITRRRAIGGGCDGGGVSHCGHHRVQSFTGHGGYDEACKEREAFAADFKGFYVSPVYKQGPSRWGWDVCPECRAT
jgi:hypothetical protein